MDYFLASLHWCLLNRHLWLSGINWWTNALDITVWLGDLLLVLWSRDEDVIWQWLLRSDLAGWIVVQHDLDLDTQDTLSQLDVLDGALHVVVDRVTRVDHEAIDELHGLRSLATQFTGDDDLNTLSS